MPYSSALTPAFSIITLSKPPLTDLTIRETAHSQSHLTCLMQNLQFHITLASALGWLSVFLGPPSCELWGVFVFTFVSRPPLLFFCLRANSSVGSRDSVSLYLTGSSLGALSQRLFLPYINMHAHPTNIP